MKKKYFTYAGIIAALLLVGMFIVICISSFPFPFLPPATTIDPITDMSVDENNMMIVTGMTTLPDTTYNISLTVSPSPGSLLKGDASGMTDVRCSDTIMPGNGGRNRWKGVCDISGLQPADYMITFSTFQLAENFTHLGIHPLATQHFTLGDEKAGPGSIRKKIPVTIPFIRINPIDQVQTAEVREITGITSLSPGIPLAWSIHTMTGETGNNTPDFEGTTMVIPGTEGVHRWSVVPGTGEMKPARYQIRITGNPAGDVSPAGTVSAISTFEVHPVSGGVNNPSGTRQVSPGFITIDALPGVHTNSVYMITGTTSLPAGKYLLVHIEPASFETDYNFSLDAKETSRNRTLSGAAVFSGVAGGISVVNGSNGNNLWSFRLETYHLGSGQYQINVSTDDIDYAGKGIVYGDLFSVRKFPIAGDTL